MPITGDLAHFHENYESNGVPTFNTDRAATLASLDRFKKLAANLKAAVIVQHDARDIGKLPAFPAAAAEPSGFQFTPRRSTDMAKTFINGNADLPNFLGKDLPPGDWVDVTQDMIDKFAEISGDHQWIHVDVERSRKESPYGTTIAHGYLTLSLMAQLRATAMDMPPARIGINYGLNKVRFTGPVPAGSRVRAVLKLSALEQLPDNGVLMTWTATVYREGADKPVLVAETLGRRFE